MTQAHIADFTAAVSFGKTGLRGWPMLMLVVLCLLATGCVRTTQPVLKDEQVTVDPSLLGQWVSEDGKESVDIQPPVPNSQTYRLIYRDSKGKQARLLGRIGKIGPLTVVELHAENPLPDASDVYKAYSLPVYSWLVVHQTTPQLIVSSMDPNWLKKYLAAHPGELKVIPNLDEPVVTSSTDEFQAFVLKHYKDPGALGKRGVLIRPHPGDGTTAATQPAAPARQ
jgi:hypothetical protein